MHLAEGTTFNGEILSKSVNETSVYSTVTNGYTFARVLFLVLAEVYATMLYEEIEFDEGTLIEEEIQALTSGELALLMLLVDLFLTATLHEVLFLGLHQFDFFLNSSHFMPPNRII